MSGPPPENRIRALEAAIALPAVAWLVSATLVLIAASIGYRALAAPLDLTLPEAAVLRDEAEVLRQIAHGVDPDVKGPIRRGVFADDGFVMTPLEAAIAARHVEVVQLLVRNGARIDDGSLPRLICLAKRNSALDIVAFLAERSPASAAADCSAVRLPW
jgi:hypothetical protein